MKRRISSIFLVVILITNGLVVFSPMSLDVRADTLEVGPGKLYLTIQSAIDVANPGDTVRVFPGVYQERINISESIILIADTPQGSTIDGQGVDNTVNITADGVTIQDFVITNGHDGINSSGYNNLQILNNNINHNDEEGIELNDCDAVTISGNNIDDNDQNGIFLINCSNVIINANPSISENGGINAPAYGPILDAHGIYIYNCTDITISNNPLIDHNYHIGIYITNHSSDITISDNTILNSLDDGINLEDVPISPTGNEYGDDNPVYPLRVDIIDNDFVNNRHEGIHIYSGSNNIIRLNEVCYNDDPGIVMDWDTGEDNTIEENKVYANGNAPGENNFAFRSGIWLRTNKSIKIQNNNEIYDNNGTGICITQHTVGANVQHEISGNRIYDNIENGIYVGPLLGGWDDTVNGVKISMNNIYNNDINGIYLNDSDDNSIIGNTINNTASGTQQYGVYINNSDGNNITNTNKIYDNIEDGIYLQSSNGSNITGNEIYNTDSGKQKIGIHLNESNANNITDTNKIYDNNEDGIYLENSDWNNITGNEIYNTDTGNQKNGIHLNESNRNNITENKKICNNKEDGIFLDNSDRNNISGNEIYNIDYGVQLNGIHLHKSNWNNISELNKIYNNRGNGILLEDSNYNNISGNEIYNKDNGNQQNGICLKNSMRNEITSGNKIYENKVYGILLDESNHNNISWNFIYNSDTGNQYDGIKLWESSYNNIFDNTISFQKQDGVWLVFSDYNEIFSNYIHNCGFHGVDLFVSYYNKAFCNTITLNKMDGFRLTRSDWNKIFINEIIRNFENGLKLDYSFNNTIEKNNIFRWDYWAIDTNPTDNKYENNYWIDGANTKYFDTNNDNIGDDGKVPFPEAHYDLFPYMIPLAHTHGTPARKKIQSLTSLYGIPAGDPKTDEKVDSAINNIKESFDYDNLSTETVTESGTIWEDDCEASASVITSGTTIGIKFEVDQDVTIGQLGFYQLHSNYSTQFSNLRLWDASDEEIIAEIENPTAEPESWGWFEIPSVALQAGEEYVVSALVNGTFYPSCHSFYLIEGGIIDGFEDVRGEGDIYPSISFGTDTLPLLDFNYSYTNEIINFQEEGNRFWEDEWHLSSDEGLSVFEKEKTALVAMENLINDPNVASSVKKDLNDICNDIVRADELLATVAYYEAYGYSGDPDVDAQLDECQKELDLAKDAWTNVDINGTPDPHYSEAIEHYKEAWKHAMQALRYADKMNGTVTFSDGNPRNVNATITLNGNLTISTKDSYKIKNITFGENQYTIEAPGYITQTGNIVLESGANILDFILDPGILSNAKVEFDRKTGEYTFTVSWNGDSEEKIYVSIGGIEYEMTKADNNTWSFTSTAKDMDLTTDEEFSFYFETESGIVSEQKAGIGRGPARDDEPSLGIWTLLIIHFIVIVVIVILVVIVTKSRMQRGRTSSIPESVEETIEETDEDTGDETETSLPSPEEELDDVSEDPD